jgi:uncharacterized protein (DUF885 family)
VFVLHAVICRLVVDTGIHALGWDMDRAIAYFMDKTGMFRKESENEVFRYASWPGQAVAYKVLARVFANFFCPLGLEL